MKNAYLLLVLIIFTEPTIAQEYPLPFKKANTITISTGGAPQMRNFISFLQQQGYMVKFDENTNSLESLPFSIKKWMNTVGTINAFEVSGSIVVTGYRTTTQMGYVKIVKMKMGSSVDGDLFDMINEVAKQFATKNGYPITYSLK